MALPYRIRKSFRKIRNSFPEISAERLFRKELNEDIPVQPERLSIGIISSPELHRLLNVNPGLNIDEMNERIGGGDLCFISEKDGEILSYHWVQLKGRHFIQSVNSHVEIVKGDAWIYHVRVKREQWGKGINGLVMAEICNVLRKRGIRMVWIYTKAGNLSQLKSLNRFGFEMVKDLPFLRIGKRFIGLRSAI